MEQLSNNKIIIGIGIAIAIVVAAFFVISQRRKKQEQLANDLKAQIASGASTMSGAITANVQPDTGYDPAIDVQTILNAKGFFNDDEEAVLNVIRNLGTKAKLKTLREAFLRAKGEELDTWLTKGFDPVLDKESQVRYSQIINSLR